MWRITEMSTFTGLAAKNHSKTVIHKQSHTKHGEISVVSGLSQQYNMLFFPLHHFFLLLICVCPHPKMLIHFTMCTFWSRSVFNVSCLGVGERPQFKIKSCQWGKENKAQLQPAVEWQTGLGLLVKWCNKLQSSENSAQPSSEFGPDRADW